MPDRELPLSGAGDAEAAADSGPAGGVIAAAARFWDERAAQAAQIAGAEAESRHWLESPLAARLVNRRVTGRPEDYPVAALQTELGAHLPVARALSVGCGTGSLERVAVRFGMAERIDGIDVSATALDRARSLAAADAALAGRIAYTEVDAATWLQATAPGRYQLILFHGSLHHIADLEAVLASCAAVLRGAAQGWLYLDEYIGPSRDQWCESDLAPARELFARVAPEHRRVPRLEQPMDADDPSEMVRSAEIEPVLRCWFEVQSYRPYGGNILYPLLSAIRGDAFAQPAIEALIAEAAAREDALAAAGSLRPLFATFLARPRPAADAAARAAAWSARRAGLAPRPAPFLDQAPPPNYETELALRRQLAASAAERRDVYREIGRLNDLVATMESTRAWRLHDWLERHLRVPLRRRRRRG
jgi:SAM-dependent methyltransferase